MKIAVLSDIHGNVPALKAVVADIDEWGPDQVIVDGDIVNRGPCSHTCLEFVLNRREEEGWHILSGNHEEYLLSCAAPDFSTDGPIFEVNRFAYWAYQQLNGDAAQLASLPERYSWWAPDSSEFRVIHASMHNSRDGLYVEQSDEALERRIAPAPAVFVTGHTHQAFLRKVNHTIIANVGSVGAPFDLDWRPSYGRFSWREGMGWNAEIHRIPYDRRLIEQDYVHSGFLKEAGPLAQIMLVELRRARGLIFRWAEKYEKAVIESEISIEDSVKSILLEEDIRPFLGPPGWVL
jgi:predicted phosphodiesterase